jgi:predicted nucleotidyltransferase
MDMVGIEQEIVSRLRQLNPERIILFGSYGYGNPDENSDLDICVISDSNIPKPERKKKIRYLLKGISIPKDILAPSVEEYEFYRKEVGSVYMEIDKKGKILWPSS